MCDYGLADGDGSVGFHNLDLTLRFGRELLLAVFNDSGGQASGVDGGVTDLVHDVGDAADMIEVAMSDKDCFDLVLSFFEIADVREDVFDADGFDRVFALHERTGS